MMKHVEEILKAAGVVAVDSAAVGAGDAEDEDAAATTATGSSTNNDTVMAQQMEAWLGLREDSDPSSSNSNLMMETTTVEDCLPLSDAVLAATVDWLVDAWTNHNGSSSSSSMSINPFLTLNSSATNDNEIRLENALDSVRATRWLRAWMEFNLSPPSSWNSEQLPDEAPPAVLTLWDELLRVDRGESSSSSSSTNHQHHHQNALLRALYQHVQDLPVLQQQLHTYSQHLQRARDENDPHSMVSTKSSSALQDPSSRLRQYERATALAARLQEEWQAHLERLEVVLGEAYARSDASQRRLHRRLLGHVWSQFVLQQQSGVSAVRQENTQAAAIRLTLRVLRRILLGSSGVVANSINGNTTAAVNDLPLPLQHLLFHQLIPLHKADGMVLWRDQTAVLELYHEPLCQCMAILLQHNVRKLVPPAVQQLLQTTSIFPRAGNTPKQVLLLHEIDTYLRLLVPVDGKQDSMKEDGPVDSLERENDLEEEEEDSSSYRKEETAMMRAVYQTLARCMASEHSRVKNGGPYF